MKHSKAACLSCRSRKVKCSGEQPVCHLCRSRGTDCTYVAGHRGGARRNRRGPSVSDADQRESAAAMLPDSPTSPHAQNPGHSPLSSGQFSFNDASGHIRDACSLVATSAFYEYYWPSHPFVPPESEVLRRLGQSDLAPDSALLLAVSFIGHRYIRGFRPSREDWLAAFDLSCRKHFMLTAQSLPTQYQMDQLQAYLLFSLGAYSSGSRHDGKRLLQEAKDYLVQFMNVHSLVPNHSSRDGNPVLVESSIRTVWQLFCVDVIFTSLDGFSFDFRWWEFLKCFPVPSCTWDRPVRRYYQSFEPNLDFQETRENASVMYNGYLYLIHVCQVIGRSMTYINSGRPVSMSNLEIDAANLLLLGPDQCIAVQDPVWVLSILLANLCLILIYGPRAQGQFPFIMNVDACGNVDFTRFLNSVDCFAVSKANSAAANIMSMIGDLVQSPNSLHYQSPLNACGISLASYVHASSVVRAQDIRATSYFSLSLSSLKRISKIWATAEELLSRTEIVAEQMSLLTASSGSPEKNSQMITPDSQAL